MTDHLLTVESLRVVYGKIVAVDAVDLTVVPGEVRLLLGANGAGKSSTLNAISGLVRPAGGRVQWAAEEIGGRQPHAIARRGVVQVPEGRRMVAPLTVEENLRLGAYAAGGRRVHEATLQRVYDTFPILFERRQVRSGMLSGGEQQMAAIGRALMSAPKVMLLDEPSMGLSPKMVDTILEQIAAIAADGIAVLTVEQNPAALDIAHYAYVMQHGEIVFDGTAEVVAQDARLAQAYVGPDATGSIPSRETETER